MNIEENTVEIEVFNKKIRLKNYLCANGENGQKKIEPVLKLTIKVTDSCDCSCPFCSNRNMRDFGKLDFDKLEKVIRELNKTGILKRISITGGEPMKYPDEVNRLINLILSINDKINIGITTSGLNLRKFLEFDNLEKIEGLHISRHHYDDKINKSIFKSDNIATSDDIKYLQSQLKDKYIININTVLNKGYIDNIEELKKMCDYVDDLGVKRIGIVSLLKLNDYAKEHFISYDEIMANGDKCFYVNDHYHNYNYCSCIDGLYHTKNNNLIEYYARVVGEEKCPYVTSLVYTTDNKLKTGFQGEEIY